MFLFLSSLGGEEPRQESSYVLVDLIIKDYDCKKQT